MSKKKIEALCASIPSIIFVITNHLLLKLNRGLWFDLVVGLLLFIVWLNTLKYLFKKYKIAGYDDSELLKIDFYPVSDVADHALKYAVIMTKQNDQWIFVRHKDRMTWEIPGGRREPNENIIRTAERELQEETGATLFELIPVCVYSVKRNSDKSYGLLCYATLLELGNPLEMEICEIRGFDTLPTDLTYPLIQPELFKKIIEFLESGHNSRCHYE